MHRIRNSGPVILSLAGAAACLLTSCVSPRYRLAKAQPSLPASLNASSTQGRLDATLGAVIIYGGPGSWKREAFWDEYVVTLHNPGNETLEVASISLQDSTGVARAAGDDPWAIERESKSLERKYRDAGTAFARLAGPRVLVAGAEPAALAGAGIGSAGAAAAASATVVALPVYGLAIWSINRHNKTAIMIEFDQRRLPLPLSLGAGESRTGSLFFAMVPSPRSLAVHLSGETADGDTVLDLASLHSLHVKPTAAELANAEAAAR